MDTITVEKLSDIEKAAEKFISIVHGKKHFAFYGSMGVGKTTFIKSLCYKLGVPDIVNSPSFAIINEYSSLQNGVIYHFDLYRINSVEEAYDFGYEDYFYSDRYCFIEWPEKIESIIPPHFIKVHIEELENQKRKITFP